MKFFDVARSVAKLSTWSDHPAHQLGSIVVLRNEIIATGYNRSKSNPLQAFYAKSAGRPDAIYPHAEMSCLMRLTKSSDLSLAKIYVFRETANGLGSAKPCEICSRALKEFGIRHVYYTSDFGYTYERRD